MSFARRMRPLPYSRIRIDDAFWSPRLEMLAQITLPQQFDQIAHQTPRLENFRRAAKRSAGGFQGRYYDDSDVYKWLQACAIVLAQVPNPKLSAMCDEAIELVVAAQEEDGYLGTHFQLDHPTLKFRNLSMLHEMYCMGHFLEAAVEWFEALNDDRLMVAADKLADLLVKNFGHDGRVGFCGHEEIELALIRYSHTRNRPEALELAKRMIDARGSRPSIFENEFEDKEGIALSPWAQRMLYRDGKYSGEYVQDHAPIRAHRVVVGHAVRAMYLYTAAAQVAKGDKELVEALEAVWRNMTERRMYVTGGIGSTASNEGFTNDYDLPNFNGYAETCASIGLAMWGRTMLEHSADSQYADVMERAIFNGAIAGISASGDAYFYENPLESRRNHARSPWFECACCPPNLARMMGGIGQYAFSEGDDALTLHFPVGATLEHHNGMAFRIESSYPQSGSFKIHILADSNGEFALSVRYPDWCDDLTMEVEGVEHEADLDSGYVSLKREWKKGEVVSVDWDLEPNWLRSNPMLFDNSGKVALAKGPLIYCLEQIDPDPEARHFAVDTESEIVEAKSSLSVEGYRLKSEPTSELYANSFASEYVPDQATLIPYFEWSNRGPSSMAVWLDEA